MVLREKNDQQNQTLSKFLSVSTIIMLTPIIPVTDMHTVYSSP